MVNDGRSELVSELVNIVAMTINILLLVGNLRGFVRNDIVAKNIRLKMCLMLNSYWMDGC